MKGDVTVNTPFDGIVVTNPYNYYIYFPDAMQWVPPRWFNFVFQWAPSPLGTVRWDTTKDPYGNTQFQNPKQQATFICSNTLSDYTGGGAFNVPPLTNTYAAFIQGNSIVPGNTYSGLLALGLTPTPIPLEASIYQITTSIAFLATNTGTGGVLFNYYTSLGLSDVTNPGAYYPNVMQLTPGYVAIAAGQSLGIPPIVVSETLPVPIPVYALSSSQGLYSATLTIDGSWNSSITLDAIALVNIIAG